MNSNSSSSSGGGITFFGILTVAFIVLKLCGVIKWSWWLVFIPLYIELLIVIVTIIGFVIYLKKMRK